MVSKSLQNDWEKLRALPVSVQLTVLLMTVLALLIGIFIGSNVI